MEQATAKSSNELAAERTKLAVYRTTLAASRSLMAWVRTGLSMIGFGFTAYKFLEDLSVAIRLHAARNLGLFLISLGTGSILFGCLEYWLFAREVRRTYQVRVRSFPIAMAAAIVLLGLVLFLGMILRVL